MSACLVDGKTTGDGMRLCFDCTEQVEYDLAEVSGVLEDLGAVVTRKTKGAPTVGGGSTTNPLPLDLDAMGKGRELANLLFSWYQMILEPFEAAREAELDRIAKMPAEDRPEPPEWPGCDRCMIPGDLSDWLRNHIDHIRKQDWAPDMKREVRDAINTCRQASDRAAGRITLGACGNSLDGIDCPGTMTATEGHREGRCRTCGATCNAQDRQLWLISEAWHVLDTLPNICGYLKTSKLLDLNYERAKKWAQRDKLAAELCDVATKVQLYTPAAVMAAYRNTPTGRRTTVA